jgi:hypothetical protein
MSGESGPGLKFLEGAAAFSKVASAHTRASGQRTAALMEAAIADAEAADARSRGGTNAARQEARTDRAVGKVRTQVAGRGFAVGVGTAGDLEAGTDLIGRLDAATIRENSRRESSRYELRASNARARAGSISPGRDAFGTLIGEAALLGNRWATESRGN